MNKVQSQDLINKSYQNEVRRSIRVSTDKQFNRTEKTRKGVAMAAPEKKEKWKD